MSRLMWPDPVVESEKMRGRSCLKLRGPQRDHHNCPDCGQEECVCKRYSLQLKGIALATAQIVKLEGLMQNARKGLQV